MARKDLGRERCPSRDRLTAYASERLVGRANEEVFVHLKHCAACLRRLAELRRVPSPGAIIQSGKRRSLWRRLWGRA